MSVKKINFFVLLWKQSHAVKRNCRVDRFIHSLLPGRNPKVAPQYIPRQTLFVWIFYIEFLVGKIRRSENNHIFELRGDIIPVKAAIGYVIVIGASQDKSLILEYVDERMRLNKKQLAQSEEFKGLMRD